MARYRRYGVDLLEGPLDDIFSEPGAEGLEPGAKPALLAAASVCEASAKRFKPGAQPGTQGFEPGAEPALVAPLAAASGLEASATAKCTAGCTAESVECRARTTTTGLTDVATSSEQ